MANSLHEKAEKGGAGCLIMDVEGTEFPAPLAQLRIGRAKGAGNLDIQNPKFKIQNPHPVGSSPTAGGNIEGLVVGMAGESRRRKFIFRL